MRFELTINHSREKKNRWRGKRKQNKGLSDSGDLVAERVKPSKSLSATLIWRGWMDE